MSGLVKEFPDQVKAQNVDATTPEASEEVQKLGFHNHGLTIRSAKGKLLWKQPDHQVDMDCVRKAIRELLDGEATAPG